MGNYNEQFLKQGQLAVLGVLKDLVKYQVPVCITWARGQFISRILVADTENIVIDFGSQERENQDVQNATSITVTAETHGAKVEFTLEKLQTSTWQDLPAFISPLPASLWFIQRREFFRINTPAHPPYYCRFTLPDKSGFSGMLQDISLGGMGILANQGLPEGLLPGMMFPQVEIDMQDWGIFTFDAQLLAISERKVIDSKNQTISTPRLSFHFLNLGPSKERDLQKVIYELERAARQKADRVR